MSMNLVQGKILLIFHIFMNYLYCSIYGNSSHWSLFFILIGVSFDILERFMDYDIIVVYASGIMREDVL